MDCPGSHSKNVAEPALNPGLVDAGPALNHQLRVRPSGPALGGRVPR